MILIENSVDKHRKEKISKSFFDSPLNRILLLLLWLYEKKKQRSEEIFNIIFFDFLLCDWFYKKNIDWMDVSISTFFLFLSLFDLSWIWRQKVNKWYWNHFTGINSTTDYIYAKSILIAFKSDRCDYWAVIKVDKLFQSLTSWLMPMKSKITYINGHFSIYATYSSHIFIEMCQVERSIFREKWKMVKFPSNSFIKIKTQIKYVLSKNILPAFFIKSTISSQHGPYD